MQLPSLSCFAAAALLTYGSSTSLVAAQVPLSLPSLPTTALPSTVAPTTLPPLMPLSPTLVSAPQPEPSALLGPMPAITPAPQAGNTSSRQTPDRGISPLVRPTAYTLAPGDRINVAIATVPEFSGVYQVMLDGYITLPVIGTVDLLGMTETQAALAIAQRYTAMKVLVKPTVTVILAEMSNIHVAVIGEVNRPGAYVTTPKNGELPQLTEIIEQAGGITQRTNLKEIEIRRPLRDGTTQVIQASLWELLTTGDLSQDMAIRDGDTIMLNAAVDIPSDVALKISNANVTPTTIQINIVGEVGSPGVQTIPTGTALNQALLMAGGFTGQAKKNSIELIRLNPNGTISRRKVSINLDQSINAISNPILQSQDVILIERSLGAKITDTVGKIIAPINSIFSLFNVFNPFFPTRH